MGFERLLPSGHLQLKCQILCLFLIMLSNLTHIDANTSALTDHGWLHLLSWENLGAQENNHAIPAIYSRN